MLTKNQTLSSLLQMSFTIKLAPPQGSTVVAISSWLLASSPPFRERDISSLRKVRKFLSILSILIGSNWSSVHPWTTNGTGGEFLWRYSFLTASRHNGAPQTNSQGYKGRNIKCSKRKTHLSDIIHRSTIKLFGPNYLINKSLFIYDRAYFFVCLFWLVFHSFFLAWRPHENIPGTLLGTVNQERNLWPRVSVLQSEVELASPR